MDLNNIMTELSLSQRVAKTAYGGWSFLFIGMYLALKAWFERKQLMLILVGHGGAAGSKLQTPGTETIMPWTLGPDQLV